MPIDDDGIHGIWKTPSCFRVQKESRSYPMAPQDI